MIGLAFTFLTLFFLTWFVKIQRAKTRKNYPPSPSWTLPLVGDLFAVGLDFVPGVARLREKHGNIVKLTMGPTDMVILYDFEDIQKAMAKDEFSARPFYHPLTAARGSDNFDDPPGLSFSSDKTWAEQRHFTLKTLRDLGFDKSLMEPIITEDVRELCTYLKSLNGGPVNIVGKLNISLFNTLWRILTSEKLSLDDPKLMNIAKLVYDLSLDLANPLFQLTVKMPKITALLDSCGILSYAKTVKAIQEVIKEVRQKHEMNPPQEGSPKDYMDAILLQMKQPHQSGSSFAGPKGVLNMETSFMDLVFSGTETTSSTLLWATLFLVKNPQMQDKAFAAIDEAFGRDQIPNWSERSKVPYIEAFLHEVHRKAALIPLSVPHRANEDTKIGDFHMDKDTVVVYSIENVHFNPEHFESPKLFNPDRHLQEGKFFPSKYVIPFGVGKRRCLGDSLAKMELFLFFCGLIQKFRTVQVPGQTYSDDDVTQGFTTMPKPFLVKFILR